MKIAAGKLFDAHLRRFIPNRVITVNTETGFIEDVKPAEFTPAFLSAEDVVDLSEQTVLPGFVDTHVHLFLHPYSERTWEDQLTKESLVERTLRAAAHAKKTLMAGFTAVRDLGTEGAADADVHLRKCMSGPNPLIPGPRYFICNRAIVCSGSYGPKSAVHVNQEGIDGITGAQVADGRDECIRAVRKQIGAGADWIKIYADYRFRSRMNDVATEYAAESQPTFSDEELEAMIETAHRCGVKVAAHATDEKTIRTLVRLGVDSIEHGTDKGDAAISDATTWNPTLATFYTIGGPPWERAARTFQRALAKGTDTIACGGDTGVFPHGENALEMRVMVRLGALPRDVLRWATFGGWRCVRSRKWEGDDGQAHMSRAYDLRLSREDGDNEVPFGVLTRGFAADIIATKGDLENDFEAAVSPDHITFVMKGGHIYKRDGKELV